MGASTVGDGRTAVVAGATGYLGRFVVSALHRAGWRVRALARDPVRLGAARSDCDEVFVGRATEPETLEGLFSGADVAFSSIGVRHVHRRPTYEEVDFEANRALADAAAAAGVRRFAFVSILDGARLRTLSPLVDARERVVDRLAALPMESIVLRPTGFFNDMGEVLAMARRGRVWLVGSGDTRINPIHGADLGDVVAGALAADPPPAEVPVGGPEVFTQAEVAELAFRLLGKRVRISRLPVGLMRASARMVGPLNRNLSALLLMFSMLGERDAVAPRAGVRRLEDEFRRLVDEASPGAAAGR